jgi:hypothetical protein
LTSPSNDNRGKNLARCPICHAPAVPEYVPFCSKRCADVDLHRWLSGSYAVPAEEDDSDGAPQPGGEAIED